MTGECKDRFSSWKCVMDFAVVVVVFGKTFPSELIWHYQDIWIHSLQCMSNSIELFGFQVDCLFQLKPNWTIGSLFGQRIWLICATMCMPAVFLSIPLPPPLPLQHWRLVSNPCAMNEGDLTPVCFIGLWWALFSKIKLSIDEKRKSLHNPRKKQYFFKTKTATCTSRCWRFWEYSQNRNISIWQTFVASKRRSLVQDVVMR